MADPDVLDADFGVLPQDDGVRWSPAAHKAWARMRQLWALICSLSPTVEAQSILADLYSHKMHCLAAEQSLPLPKHVEERVCARCHCLCYPGRGCNVRVMRRAGRRWKAHSQSSSPTAPGARAAAGGDGGIGLGVSGGATQARTPTSAADGAQGAGAGVKASVKSPHLQVVFTCARCGHAQSVTAVTRREAQRQRDKRLQCRKRARLQVESVPGRQPQRSASTVAATDPRAIDKRPQQQSQQQPAASKPFSFLSQVKQMSTGLGTSTGRSANSNDSGSGKRCKKAKAGSGKGKKKDAKGQGAGQKKSASALGGFLQSL